MGSSPDQAEGGYQVHSLKELEGFNSSTPRYEKEGGCICFEYIWLNCLPQSFGAR
ncbi:hypothetical protein Goklo_007270 [Gossypium klotzschianum]|uniref:Uncharacterized protein n=1 Tax=Gossypium klotzschianum TaxID=34286 RepID=A0A7J8WBF9_9ROSI|nr:hypothetical protein [Gossypium klotzschianum]MBA0671966.1 hypothetical protein [Gossypium klotzschianum]MBA0671969.1 hypothetical protein [Gossypium klotzschianum]